MNTERVEFVSLFGGEVERLSDLPLYPALVSALTAPEAISLLDLTFEQPYPQRRAILKKIGRDIENRFEPVHEDLLRSLINAVPKLRANKRQSCGHCLTFLHEYVPDDWKREIEAFFVGSEYLPLRKRGYKILRHEWDSDLTDHVERAWIELGDGAAAGLIVEKFPIEYLVRHFDALEAADMADWQWRRLYLRVAEVDRTVINRLREKDEITYCYVRTKLGETLDPAEARRIFDQYIGDERDSLLVWCFGQMGLWDVLKGILEDREELEGIRRRRRIEALGLRPEEWMSEDASR